jgi:hypothetical protein
MAKLSSTPSTELWGSDMRVSMSDDLMLGQSLDSNLNASIGSVS